MKPSNAANKPGSRPLHESRSIQKRRELQFRCIVQVIPITDVAMVSKIDEWALNVRRRDRAIYLRGLYETMAVQLYGQYEPTRTPAHRISSKFLTRLESWLNCFENERDKWSAFRSLEYVLFAGQNEFDELYRHAAENIVKPWLIDSTKADLFDPNIDRILEKLLNQCWICPATDSLRINGFLHVSHMQGKAIRPDWHSLRQLGSSERIGEFVQKNDVRYLVLLEDFVGTGRQFSKAVGYAASVFKGPILAIPLIICAPGHHKMQDTIAKGGLPNVTYSPGLILTEDCLVGKKALVNQPNLFPKLRAAMKSGYLKIKTDIKKDLDGEEFGWKGTGSLVVLYSNCPNNTPPIFHYVCENWQPLFPRSSRA